MKRIITVVNIIVAIYFFVLANLFFWLSFFLFPNLIETPYQLPVNIIFAMFLMGGAVIFFTKTREKYLYGIIILSIIWLEISFFITQKFGELNISTILFLGIFFGIPLIVLFLNRYLEEKLSKQISIPPYFLKILITAILVIFVTGGILAWQYLRMQKNEILKPTTEKICSYQININDIQYQYGIAFVAKDRNCATLIKSSEGDALNINSVLTKIYPDIFLNQSSFSPDGKHFSFVASNLKDNGRGDFFFNLNGKFQRFVISDDIRGTTYNNILSNLQYSQDGKRLGYCAKQDEQYLKIIDGREQLIIKEAYLNDGCNSIFGYDLSPNRNYNFHQTVTSNDRQSVLRESSCENTRATCKIYKTLILATGDKKEFGPYYDYVNYTQFSPDSKHFTYSAQIFEDGRPGVDIGRQYTAVILDGEVIDKYNEVWNLKFSDDNQFLIYNTRLHNDICYVVKSVD